MTVKQQGIGIIPDNETTYYNYLIGYLESIDHYAVMAINRSTKQVSFRITPSESTLLIPLLDAVKDIHNRFGIKVVFSKSIKRTDNISFTIPI